MINAFYSGVSGAKGFQNSLNVTANNMANLNTVGYEAQQAHFTDLLYSGLQTPHGDTASLQTGNGVKISAITSVCEPGNLEQTGNGYDVAIAGNGYFCIRDQADHTYFTKDGNFHLQQFGEQTYLVTSNGNYVLNDQFAPITVDENTTELVLVGSGGKEANTTQNSDEAKAGAQIARLAVCDFNNPEALLRDGYGRLSALAGSGEGVLLSGAKVVSGALEASNVDITSEMMHLMQAQRGFQFSAKVMQTADELENTANNLRQ